MRRRSPRRLKVAESGMQRLKVAEVGEGPPKAAFFSRTVH
jgi:hypothetical protein